MYKIQPNNSINPGMNTTPDQLYSKRQISAFSVDKALKKQLSAVFTPLAIKYLLVHYREK